MLGEVFGLDFVVVLLVLVIGLVVPVWAIVDAASRPS
jgi:hypothetical protein